MYLFQRRIVCSAIRHLRHCEQLAADISCRQWHRSSESHSTQSAFLFCRRYSGCARVDRELSLVEHKQFQSHLKSASIRHHRCRLRSDSQPIVTIAPPGFNRCNVTDQRRLESSVFRLRCLRLCVANFYKPGELGYTEYELSGSGAFLCVAVAKFIRPILPHGVVAVSRQQRCVSFPRYAARK